MPEVIYKEVPVIELAPDALLFINGSDTIKDENDEAYEIRNDITSITISLNIESVPGSATFVVSMPDHSIRRYGNRTYRAVAIMSEVEIYMKGRFEVKRKSGPTEYPYYPVFWGMIVSVSEAYADGINTLTFTCSDILYWWKIIKTGTNIAAVATEEAREDKRKQEEIDGVDTDKNGMLDNPALQASAYGNRYANWTIPGTLVNLARTTTLDFTPFKVGVEYEAGIAVKKNTLSTGVGKQTSLGEELQTNMRNTIIDYWKSRFEQIGRGLRIYGFTSKIVEGPLPFIEFKFEFAKEPWEKIRTGTLNAGGPVLMETVMKSKLEIANELRDMIQFEFYMDVNGEIIFKPPFYNMNTKENVISRIEDIDIITLNFIQSESEIVTRMDVTGQISLSTDTSDNENLRRGIAIDPYLVQQYGLRIQTRKTPWLNTSAGCLIFAKGELDKMNSKAKTGSLTIVGRPELKLGYPLYMVSRDTFYYIKSIEHSFTFGGQFTTTVGIINERRMVKDSQGIPIKNRLFRSAGELKDNAVTIEGGTSIIDDKINNYVKQMAIQSLCHPNSEVIKKIEKPNYKSQIDDIKSEGGEKYEVKESKEVKDNDREITNLEGYELIGLFKYGKNLKFENNILKVIPEDKKDTGAAKALGLDKDSNEVYFSPNNSAFTSITLDDKKSSMLMIQSDDIETYAYRAQNLTPSSGTERE